MASITETTLVSSTGSTAASPIPVKSAKKETELEVINYDLLQARDKNEITKLVDAASSRGIFFLDLNGPSAKEVRSDLPHILKAQRDFFDRPNEEKDPFKSPLPERGYERHDEVQVETLLLSREEELNGKLEIPKQLEPVKDRLANVSNFSDFALRDLFHLLSTNVEPPVSTESAADPKAPSYTNLTLGRSLARPETDLIPEHADSGIITLLYYDEPSLEILHPVTKEWEVVKVRPGLQAVYVGKYFSEISGGRFKAALHRVIQPGEGTAMVVYLLHPTLSSTLKSGDA